MDSIKLLIWGDAVIETGFARVLHMLAKHFPARISIGWIGVNYFGDPHKYPYRIYPASLRGDIYGINRIEDIIKLETPDVILILNDAWIQDVQLSAIKKAYEKSKLPKIITYTPVDAKDHDPEWYKNFDIVTYAVAYSEFGKQEMLKACPELSDRLLVIPHGVDTSIFYQLPRAKRDNKRLIFPNRADFLDSFVVLNANRNQPRKRIDITLKAFETFVREKPENVKLYLHMGIQDSHINIQKLAKRLGIEKRLIVTNLNNGVQVIPVEKLNLVYNATDVGLNTGLGEGWGLTNIEHAVTGAPQIVPDSSSLSEIYRDCGLLVPPTMEYTLDQIMTTGSLVHPDDVAERLETLYVNQDLYNTLAQSSIAKFTSPEYQWKNIAQRWVKLFEE